MTLDPDALIKLLGAGIVALGGYVWNKLDNRVSHLEEALGELAHKDDVQDLSDKIDDGFQRAEERHTSLMETLLNR